MQKQGESMYLFFIVYDEVLEGEVSSVVDKVRIDRYIKWNRVKGEWKEKHMGTHVWPGEYNTICVLIEDEQLSKLKQKVKELQQEFPADEIWGWVASVREII